MDKQNILSQVQQGIDSTQNISTLNQLCQKDLDSNQKSNSKSSPSIMKEQEDKYFDTLNKENSQDVKQLSKEDIEEIQNKENSLSDEKELPKKTKSHQISQTTEEKQSENQILNQGNILNAKTDGEDQNIPISLDSDLTQKKKIKCSINRNQAKRPNDELSIEKKLTEKKQYSDKQEKEEKIFDSEIIKDKKSSNGLVIPDEQIQDKQQNKEWIFDGISKSDQPQPDAFNLQVDQIKTKQLEIEKQLTITYASQLEKIANQIKELKINGKDLDQQKFESINESQIQSNAFQDQKTKIFQKLNENNVQFIKILTSHDKQTLVLGIQKQLASELTDKNIKEIISFIYHNSTEQELVCLNQIFNTLQIKFDFIKIEQDNISIYNVQKKDFEALIYEKFKILTKFEQSVYQIKDYYYVIDSNNFPQNCQNCENYQCFQNTKARIIAFLQFKKHFYCEYQNKNKQTEELIFKLSKEEIITFYINFVYKLIFRFLENGEANEQNVSNENEQIQKIPDQPYQKKNNAQIFNEDQFKDYLDQNIQKRQLDISELIPKNSNYVSEIFKKEQNDIISLLKEKNYYLCQLLILSIINEDVFIGYQEEIEGVYQDFVFVIKYSPLPSEIQKYFLIEQFNEEIIHFIIKNQIHILILSKDAYFQIQINFEYLKGTKIDWTKDYFEIINKNSIINQKNCNKCEKCKQHQQCPEYLPFRQFQEQKDTIFENLIKKNYYICEYLSKGGEGLVFQGYQQNFKDKQEVVFKILLFQDEKELQNEIEIMKLFDQNINVIKFIDHVKINSLIHILVLEKCQFSLKDQLEQISKKKIFPIEQLLQMIFSLLDGLIQFRIYNILHLDIKPQNILVTKSGNYVFTDFGMSSLKKKDQKIYIKGYTKSYAAPEQLKGDESIEYTSDVYSLGKTFEIILKFFEDIQQQNYKDFISKLKKIINDKMIQNQSNQRLNCLELSNEFFQEVLKEQICSSFLNLYIPQIKLILKSYPYDKNKEIPYFLLVSLFYHQNILDFYQSDIIQSTLLADKQILQNQISISLVNLGRCYKDLGDFQKALQCQLESLQIRKSIFKEEHLDIATSLNNVGCCYQNLGDNKMAIKYQLESLQIRQSIFKEDHADIATSLNDISNCYKNLGDNKTALEYQLESLQMMKQIFKEDHPLVAEFMSNVGLCYQNLGDDKKALEYQLESLKMIKQAFKEIHPSIATALNNVGSCYQNLGDNKKALEYFQESLQMTKQIFKEVHPSIAISLNNVALCYVNLGDNNKALGYLEKSLQIRKQIFKQNHPSIAISLNNVGTCYKNLGDYKKALDHLLESLQMRKQIFKEDHPDIAVSLNNVGNCYMKIGNNKKALEYLLESLQMTKQISKENKPLIATLLNNVGESYKNLGENKKALDYFLESLQIFQQIFKENHPSIASSLNNIGSCYQNLGDNKKALKYLQESLQMRKQIFKEDHPNIVSSLNNVGLCLQNLGFYNIALEYQLESLQMSKKIFQKNHPLVATSLNNLGLCYQNLGYYKKAIEYQLESLQIRKQIFVGNHPLIAISLYNIGSCYQDLGDIKMLLEYQLEYLQMMKQIYNEDHPDIATTINNIGFFYKILGDNKKALEYKEEYLKLKKKY